MINQEFFANYGTEKWAVEENLCYLLQGYWEDLRDRTGVGRELPAEMPLNPVGFVKEFMKEETLVNTDLAEQSKMDTLEKNVVVEADESDIVDVEGEVIDPMNDKSAPSTMDDLLKIALASKDL